MNIELARRRYAELNKEADKLVMQKRFLLENTDITGGQKGYKCNQRIYNQVKDIDKRLRKIKRLQLTRSF